LRATRNFVAGDKTLRHATMSEAIFCFRRIPPEPTAPANQSHLLPQRTPATFTFAIGIARIAQ
jgi:hypothetical protein